MDVPQYFADVAEELARKSRIIRRDFATHHGSGGQNRESILANVLTNYLPREFGIGTGLVASHEGQFSHQADLLIMNKTWNAPLHPTGPNQIWLVESIYAMIEVKTMLSPSAIGDSVAKCRRFKQLPRTFSDAPFHPRISESLFVMFSFESPSTETAKRNLTEAIATVPPDEQPDFIIVPDQYVGTSGSYRALSIFGQPGSPYRQQLEQQHGSQLQDLDPGSVRIYAAGGDSLFIWLIWLLSWLSRAGPRSSELLSYLPPDKTWGTVL